MSTTTTTTTNQADDKAAKQPLITADDMRRLIGDIGSLSEAYESLATKAFDSICAQAAERSELITRIYGALNKSHRANSTNPTDMSFAAFYSALVSTCELLGMKVSDRAETRRLWTFAVKGNTAAAQTKFKLVVMETGDFDITFSDYLKYLSRADDYTPKGKLTSAAANERAERAERAEQDKLVRDAAKTARPLQFDFSTLAAGQGVKPTDVKGRAKFLLQLQQDLAVYVSEVLDSLTDKQVDEVRRSVNRVIVAAAK